MRKQTLILLTTLNLLVACKSVPAVTEVQVPSGTTIFNGTYSGTLTEGLWLVDAVLSSDQQHLYVAAESSNHTTILDINPQSGLELRRMNVSVSRPQQLVERSDHQLVIAGWYGSGVVDPTTLQLVRALPPAQQVSADGEVLLNPQTIETLDRVRYSTRDGHTLSSVTPPQRTAWMSSDDLNWQAYSDGKTILNIATGQTVDVSGGHLDPCKRMNDLNPPRLLTLEGVPSGLFLAYSDGTMEWRSAAGAVQNIQKLDIPCPTSTTFDGLNDMQSKVFGSTVLFYSRGSKAGTSVYYFGEASLIAPSKVVVDTPNTKSDFHNWFEGMFAFRTAATPLLSSAEPTLEKWTQWKQSYVKSQFPVSAAVQATYRDQKTYDLNGTFTTPAGDLTLAGTGKVVESPDGPKIIFTQALCSPLLPPYCPATDWEADLLKDGARIGHISSYNLEPSGGTRSSQRGATWFGWNGEDRSFTFTLNPQ